jgi:hypothetical protein
MSGDYKLGHQGGTATDAWLKSVGEDSLAKATAAINTALATLEELLHRLDRLAERDARAAAAAARSRHLTPESR